MLQRDGNLLEQTIASAVQLDSAGDERISLDLKRLENKIAALSRKINDLSDMAGEGSDEDRALLKAKVRAAQLERLTEEAERARLQSALSTEARTITPEEVRILLSNLTQLLIDGAAGKLGGDLVHRAADVFRKLVGGRIWVRVERRAGRKRTNVRGVFTPVLLPTVQAQLGDNRSMETEALETWVWLRQPPKRDRLAGRVYQLIDVQGHSYRAAADILRHEGHNVNSGVVWQIRQRYFEMIGEPVPQLPYNNGKGRNTNGADAA